MDPTPAVPAPSLFSLVGQNVLITGATRGVYNSTNLVFLKVFDIFSHCFNVSSLSASYLPRYRGCLCDRAR